MRYNSEYPNADVVKELLAKMGMTSRQISKMVFDSKTHRDIVGEIEKKKNMQCRNLIRLCNILDIPLDYLFVSKDDKKESPSVIGNNNVVNSSYVNHDITSLRAENKALKLVIQEKDARLIDLKKTNEDLGKRLDYVLRINHDEKSPLK